MSKSRAKKKQRRRSRVAPAAPGTTAQERAAARARTRAQTPPAARESATADRPQRRPSRLDVRAGVARPDAIWAPFPLTEIGMAVGIALFALGFVAGTGALFLRASACSSSSSPSSACASTSRAFARTASCSGCCR